MAPPPASFILLLKAPLSTPEIIQGVLQSPNPPEILEGERQEDEEMSDESGEDHEDDDQSDTSHSTEADADDVITDDEKINPRANTDVRFCRLAGPERDRILAWLNANHPNHHPVLIRLASPPTSAQRLTRATDLSRKGLDPTMPQHMPTNADTEDNLRYLGSITSPTYYFFYGTLAQPNILRKALSLPEPYQPKYRNAKLIGRWSLKEISGGHLALAAEASEGTGSDIEGMAWECANEMMAERLAAYETGAYEEIGVEIVVEGKGVLWGRTFVGVPGVR